MRSRRCRKSRHRGAGAAREIMDIVAKARYVRISPRKARDLARAIQGQTVADALKVTEVSERKAGILISKTLKSAIANAEHNQKVSVDDLRVKTAVVDQGPSLKRFWPRSRGMASPILKRTSHIVIVLTDGK
jgi:large subunit ribosomal protein L22